MGNASPLPRSDRTLHNHHHSFYIQAHQSHHKSCIGSIHCRKYIPVPPLHADNVRHYRVGYESRFDIPHRCSAGRKFLHAHRKCCTSRLQWNDSWGMIPGLIANRPDIQHDVSLFSDFRGLKILYPFVDKIFQTQNQQSYPYILGRYHDLSTPVVPNKSRLFRKHNHRSQ